jgi:hypothetical protein
MVDRPAPRQQARAAADASATTSLIALTVPAGTPKNAAGSFGCARTATSSRSSSGTKSARCALPIPSARHRQKDATNDHDHQRNPGERSKIPPVVKILWRRIVDKFAVDECKDRQPVIYPVSKAFRTKEAGMCQLDLSVIGVQADYFLGMIDFITVISRKICRLISPPFQATGQPRKVVRLV